MPGYGGSVFVNKYVKFAHLHNNSVANASKTICLSQFRKEIGASGAFER
jgi:hypothetical protein